MKRTFLLLLIILILSCKKQSPKVENELYDCLMSSLSDYEKKKAEPIILNFEKHLIDKEILESSSPESYLNLYKKIAKLGVYDFSNDFNFSEKISFLNRKKPSENQGLIDCHSKVFQSEKYLKSKLYKFTKEMQSLRKHRVTPVIIAKTTIKYLSEEDFELEYNRFNTLMFIETYNTNNH